MSERNVAPTIAQVIQFVIVEQATPNSRDLSGWISEQSTQTIGPALIAKPAIIIIVMMAARYGTKEGALPPSSIVMQTPTMAMDTAMTKKPILSAGLRPDLSTMPTAMNVASVKTMPLMTVPIIWSSVLEKPARLRIFGE